MVHDPVFEENARKAIGPAFLDLLAVDDLPEAAGTAE